MPISVAYANKVLNKIHRNEDFTVTSTYQSLHTGDPGKTGANELSGGGYVRKPGSFTAASGGATETSGDVKWTNLPGCTVTHMGEWDALSGGGFIMGGALSSPQVVNEGGTLDLYAGELDVVFP